MRVSKKGDRGFSISSVPLKAVKRLALASGSRFGSWSLELHGDFWFLVLEGSS
jgi:hypothetical protein